MNNTGYMDNAYGFVYDWRDFWTARRAEQELPGFKFLGPGWYVYKTGALLVVPHGTGTRKTNATGEADGTPCFQFFSYSHNPAQAFNEIVNAPTRVDERDH